MTAIEEMAGMDVLCSDKTGTLTLNKLTVDRNLIEVKCFLLGWGWTSWVERRVGCLIVPLGWMDDLLVWLKSPNRKQ